MRRETVRGLGAVSVIAQYLLLGPPVLAPACRLLPGLTRIRCADSRSKKNARRAGTRRAPLGGAHKDGRGSSPPRASALRRALNKDYFPRSRTALIQRTQNIALRDQNVCLCFFAGAPSDATDRRRRGQDAYQRTVASFWAQNQGLSRRIPARAGPSTPADPDDRITAQAP